jgi:hypothetical protein
MLTTKLTPQIDYRLTTSWLQTDYRWLQMTTDWLQTDYYRWLQADYRLTTSWLQTDYRWLQADWLQMTTSWLQTDYQVDELTTIDLTTHTGLIDWKELRVWQNGWPNLTTSWLQVWWLTTIDWLHKELTTSWVISWLQNEYLPLTDYNYTIDYNNWPNGPQALCWGYKLTKNLTTSTYLPTSSLTPYN